MLTMWRATVAAVVEAALDFTVGAPSLLSAPPRVFGGTSLHPDCDIDIPRRPVSSLPGAPIGIVPAADAQGLLVAWQDGDAIMLRRFRRDCSQYFEVEVNRTRDFYRLPGGLWDVVGLADGRVAVAWVLGADVWVRVVEPLSNGGGQAGPVRANAVNDGYARTEVRLAANVRDLNEGFAVAWSSWGQDSDGWGIFARRFSGVTALPLGEAEVQVNAAWQQFQWRPELKWCGSTLWAMWTNSSGSDVACQGGVGGCATGPLLRRLAVADHNDTWTIGEEINFNDTDQLAAALSCREGHGHENAATVVWLEADGNQVSIAHSDGDDQPPNLLLATATSAASAQGFRSSPRDAPILSSWQQLRRLGDAALGQQVGASEDPLAYGDVSLLACSGLMVVLGSDARGALSAQLLDFGRLAKPLAYQPRQVFAGARLARAIWDRPVDGPGVRPEGDGDEGLVVCWLAGPAARQGYGVDNDSNSFRCLRRKVQWLVSSGEFDFGSSMVAIILVSSVVAFVWLRHCATHGCITRGNLLPFLRRRAAGDAARRRTPPQPSQARIRELREQLEAIPMVPTARGRGASTTEALPSRAPSGATAPSHIVPEVTPNDGEGRDSSEAWVESPAVRLAVVGGIDPNCCAICQNEVTVRVALQSCGHTACRDCVLRLVELNQRCHICRGPIEGVQPVYI